MKCLPVFPFLLGALVGAVLTLLVLVASNKASASAASLPASLSSDQVEDAVQQVRHWQGSPDAPVTVIEFADYYCPYCGDFADSEAAAWLSEQVQQGKVRFGYVHLAFLGPYSTLAAMGTECAADQDGFWTFHDALNAALSANPSHLNMDGLSEIAGQSGLEEMQFLVCMDEQRHAATVAGDLDLSTRLSVTSTPTFLVGGHLLVGNQGISAFQALVDAALQGR